MAARKAKWLNLAEELLESLAPRPEDADYDDENLEWSFYDEVSRFVIAAKLRPAGVKAAKCKDWPKVIADTAVTDWHTQEWVAEAMGRDVRTIRRWEGRGLLSFGEGKDKRYPSPHVLCWCLAYHALKERRRIDFLPMEIAFGKTAETSSYIGAPGDRLRTRSRY